VLKTDEEVNVRSSEYHSAPVGGHLQLIVLRHNGSTATCRAANSITTVHKLVVMDSSYGVFRAQLITSLSRNINSWNITNGSTIAMKHYNWIWHDN